MRESGRSRADPLARLNERQRRRHRRRNLLQSLLLLIAMGLLLIFCAFLLLGPTASLWAALGWLLAVVVGPRMEPAAALTMVGAQPLPRESFPRGYAILDHLSERARLQRNPPLYYLPSRQLNAFTVGRHREAAIAVTGGLLQHLNGREFAAVMAHEIGHIVNHDLWVMNLADSLSRLTRILGTLGVMLLFFGLPLLLAGGGGISWFLGALLLALAPTLASLLQLALSRTREFDADLEAVALTGDPEGLISALSKLERQQHGIWQFLTGQGRRDAPSLLRSHPATAERIERLKSLQAEPDLVNGWSREFQQPRELPSRRF
ncbi:MAG TPA: zinc metalloprotease HtpX [Kiloniellales bacterium]|nr:zinc metalloprotease HtpX [Kiloniellales bacterium]